jgi:hypothetical protein
VQNQAASGASQQSAAKKNLSAQRGGPTIRCQAAGALEFSQQFRQPQDAAEGRFGRKELLQAKLIRRQIVFQFRDAVLRVGAAVVVAPDRAI